MVDLARPDDHGPHDPGRAGAAGGLLTRGDREGSPRDSAHEPDPDELLRQLRRAAGDPPVPPLRLADAAGSARGGPAGRIVTSARRAVLRLIAPVLGDLLGQLERDRSRTRTEIERLQRRVAELEREAGSGTDR